MKLWKWKRDTLGTRYQPGSKTKGEISWSHTSERKFLFYQQKWQLSRNFTKSTTVPWAPMQLEYFVDRQNVQAKIRKEMEDVNVDQEAEEFVDEQDAHEKDQNETEFDYHMNEPVERNNKSFIL
ncbi:unnamed protein product [Caenorhabditis nigoni]